MRPRPCSFLDGALVIGKGTTFAVSFYVALEAAFVGLDTRSPRDILDAQRARPEHAKRP